MRIAAWLASCAFCLGVAGAADARPDWVRSLERVGAWLDPASTNPPVVTCRLRVTEAAGFAPGFADAVVDVALQAPDRCRLGWGTNRTRIEFGRTGPRLWLWEPASGRLLEAPVGAASDGIRPSVGLPVSPTWIRLLPTACGSTNRGEVVVAGQRCSATSFWPGSTARDWFGVEPFVVTLWSRRADDLPVAVRWQVPSEKLSLTAWPTGLKAERAGAAARWQPPGGGAGGKTARVMVDEPGLRRRLPAVVAFLAAELGATTAGP